ncbi:hypothetical protein Cgig2_033998 [Carnegiea gigantea]|uniref:Uncharacterized protein n=1 Tax=Carnegiea gigantea TaxID=171969 RepID=A0A9Q1Q8B4_9CARY|nr:hypothetical protein Cgig2_033998 [Carnegiea gigantea]
MTIKPYSRGSSALLLGNLLFIGKSGSEMQSILRERERERERERTRPSKAEADVGVTGLTWGHRRSTWGFLNLGFPGASVDLAHRRPVIFLGRPSRFLFRSTIILWVSPWLRLVLRVPIFSVTAGEVSTGDPIADDLPRRNRMVFSQICLSPSGFYPSEASTEVAGTFCCSRWHSRRSHYRRQLFQSLESRRSSNFRAEKFLQLSVINKGKRTFVIFLAGWNEKSWAKIFDALTEIVNLAFLCTSGALRRPLHQVTLAHGVVPPPLPPPPPPPGCCPKYDFIREPECFLCSVAYIAATKSLGKVNEAVQEPLFSKLMQMDRGKQKVITELGLRASSSVSTQGCSCESRVSVYANWPPDALFVHDTYSALSDEGKSFDLTLFEAKIYGHAFSNTSGSLTRDVIVSHQVHRGSVVLDIHPISDPLNLSNEQPPSPSLKQLPFPYLDRYKPLSNKDDLKMP